MTSLLVTGSKARLAGYTVEEVWVETDEEGKRWIRAVVRYDQDGGTGRRAWMPNDKVPLEKPK